MSPEHRDIHQLRAGLSGTSTEDGATSQVQAGRRSAQETDSDPERAPVRLAQCRGTSIPPPWGNPDIRTPRQFLVLHLRFCGESRWAAGRADRLALGVGDFSSIRSAAHASHTYLPMMRPSSRFGSPSTRAERGSIPESGIRKDLIRVVQHVTVDRPGAMPVFRLSIQTQAVPFDSVRPAPDSRYAMRTSIDHGSPSKTDGCAGASPT